MLKIELEVENLGLRADVERLHELLGELYEVADEAVGCVDLDEILCKDLADRLASELED